MKKVIGLLTALSMLVSMLGAFGTVAFGANPVASVQIVENEYYFEDFSGYNGGDFTMADNGYYQRNESSGHMSLYQDSEYGNALKITNNTTAFPGGYIDGPRGTGNGFKLSADSFENADDATLVYSYDVYIHQPSEVNGSGIYGCVNIANNGFSSTKSVSTSPMYTNRSTGGNMIFAPVTTAGTANWTGGNTTDKISANEVLAGKWYKMQSVIKYDKDTSEYVTTYFVNGEKITNSSSGEASEVRVSVSDEERATREYFGVSIAARNNSTATTTEDYFIVDNMALYQYGATEATPAEDIEEGVIEIPLSNKYAYTNANKVPAELLKGYGDKATYENITIFVNGETPITANTNGSDANTIKITLPEDLEGGDTITVSLDGVCDIAGKSLTVNGSLEYRISGGELPPSYSVIASENEYYLEDFAEYTYDEEAETVNGAGFVPNSNSTGNFAVVNDAERGNILKITNDTTNFKGGNANFSGNVQIAQSYFEENPNASLVFSYDAYINQPTNTAGNGLFISIFATQADGTNITSAPISCLPMFTHSSQKVSGVEKGNIFFAPTSANWNAGYNENNYMKLEGGSEAVDGKWYNVKSVLKFDAENNKYITTYYVDGKPITNQTTGEKSVTEVVYENYARRTGFSLALSARNNDTDATAGDYFAIDNLAVYQYGGTVAYHGEETEGRKIEIPLENNYDFQNEETPDAFFDGFGDSLTYGNVKISVNGDTEIVADTQDSEVNCIVITLPSSVRDGDMVYVNLSGVCDIAGNAVLADGDGIYTVCGIGEIPDVPAGNVSNNEYFLEDFSDYDSIDESNGVKFTSADSSEYISLAQSEKYGKSLALNYPEGEGSKGVNLPVGTFNIDPATFENNEGAVLAFSYDMYVPKTKVVGRMVHTWLSFADESGNTVKYVSMLPTLRTDSSGTMYFYGSGRTDDNDEDVDYETEIRKSPANGANLVMYDAKAKVAYDAGEDSWVRVMTLVTYEDGYYVSRFYLNGTPITRQGETAPAIMKVKDNGAGLQRSAIMFSMGGRTGAGAKDSDRILIDNFCVRMYDGITMDKFIGISNESTAVDLEFKNGFTFRNSNVLSGVSRGEIKETTLSAKNFDIEIFSPEDKFFLYGSKVSNFIGKQEDNVITLSNLPARNSGEIMKIKVDGIVSVDDQELDNNIVVVAEENFSGVTGAEFIDINGEVMEIGSINSVSTSVIKLKLGLKNVRRAELVCESENKVYTAVNGVFNFENDLLSPGKTYVIKLDGVEYASFNTETVGSIMCSDIEFESGRVKLSAANTSLSAKTVFVAVMLYGENGELVKINCEPKTIVVGRTQTIATDIPTDESGTILKAVVFEDLSDLLAITRPTAISVR